MKRITPDDFPAYFQELHGHEPFPWQTRLARLVLEAGAWPDVLDLPTGSGKTAAIDIAVFHLASQAPAGPNRRAPLRIAFVVNRRLVVDDAYERAQRISQKLARPTPGSVLEGVAQNLRILSGEDVPLIACRLRGGVPREDVWTRTPSQPTVLCSTVDQIGSRLLFRGYGVSDRMKPVHAGLIGSDCLILLDEAHLAEPFRQTLEGIARHKGGFRNGGKQIAPWGMATLTATPGNESKTPFGLSDEDLVNPTLKTRLEASKPARLYGPEKGRVKTERDGSEETKSREVESKLRTERILQEVCAAQKHFPQKKIANPAIGIVVNRVGRAREVFNSLRKEAGDSADVILLVGPSRQLERDLISRRLSPIRTGAARTLEKPLLIVATQCIEAGVDIDLDALITELASLDALRQRFGRLNRAGRDFEPFAAILAGKTDLSTREEDPVYGLALRATWDYLNQAAEKKGGQMIADFGLLAFQRFSESHPIPPETLSPKEAAPILLPSHLDLLGQTSPPPNPDPDIALYLHGPSRQPDAVSLVWRSDIRAEFPDATRMRRLLTLLPPRSGETIELPIWAVRRWLEKRGKPETLLETIADVSTLDPDEAESRSDTPKVFRWRGDEEGSTWITADQIKPGDTLVLPSTYGGVDEYGWTGDVRGSQAELDNERPLPADLAEAAAEPYWGRRYVVRLHPALAGEGFSQEKWNHLLSTLSSQPWRSAKNSLDFPGLPAAFRRKLSALLLAKHGNVQIYPDLYGSDERETSTSNRGIVLVAPIGLKQAPPSDALDAATLDLAFHSGEGVPNSTEDDAYGSSPGFGQSLEEHSREVQMKAEELSVRAGLKDSIAQDIALAGFLHDAGKADPRFQSWLAFGDPLGYDPEESRKVVAKSGRLLPGIARARSGLPEHWRHEALSVRLAIAHPRFAGANDPELVLWLIGTHHGFGRPFYPHCDPLDGETRILPNVLGLPRELPPGEGPQSLAFDRDGLDWAGLYDVLKERYGLWELARLEAILRLSDHRASEDAAVRYATQGEAP